MDPPPVRVEGFSLRAVIFANGDLAFPEAARHEIRPEDWVLAADGGVRHVLALGLSPDLVVGDLDSLTPETRRRLEAGETAFLPFPAEKDATDLELALRHAAAQGASEALVFGAVGSRWDQTLANLLLPALESLAGLRVTFRDGPQEACLLRGGEERTFHGRPGDTLSLLPLAGDAVGVTTEGLRYPLREGTLRFGASRGVSNELTAATATVRLRQGLLFCNLIRKDEGGPR